MIERKIIIGLIVSTEFCEKIKPIWNPLLLESATAKRLAGWIWEYYNEYKRAPGKDMEGIYYSKIKETKLAKELAEEIEQDILPGLSAEFTRDDFNLEFLLIESTNHLNTRHLTLHNESVQALLEAGKTEEAQKLIKQFQPLGLAINRLNDFILTAPQIRRKETKQPLVLMKPWLKQGQLTIIYANYGVGKSLLTMAIAYVLGVKNYDDKKCEIGEWQVKNPCGCLYIDGELGELEMEERLSKFEWIGKQPPAHKMSILSVPEYQLETEDVFTLSDRKNQLMIIQWLKEHPTYKLVVLDSASTLFGLVEENDNSEWSTKINPFIRDLRALGVACIMLHHSGKDGKRGLRGASAMGAMAHNIFKLTNHGDKSDGEAWFTIAKDKQRAGGYSFAPFNLHFTQNDAETQTSWKSSTLTD